MKTKTLIILGLGTTVVFATGCAEFGQFIAGNEEAVANTIEGAGTTVGGILGVLLPPPFGTIAASAVTGLAAWGAERTRSYNKGAASIVAMINEARTTDPTFNSAFDGEGAGVTAMKNVMRENKRLRKAFNKTLPDSEVTL